MINNPAEFFRKFSNQVSRLAGSFWAFIVASSIVFIWLITGPLFQFSNTWQLVINTGTTIITFLMVFLIQNAQNRESKSLHLKIDELIRATKNARNEMINSEAFPDKKIEALEDEFIKYSELGESKNKRKIHSIL